MAGLKVIDGGRSRAARFDALLRQHYDVLYRIAYRFTRSVPDAEDLVQELCVRAYPRLDEIERLEDPRGWLICVLRRIYIDQTRRYERSHVSSVEDTDEHALASELPGPFEEAARADSERRLAQAWRHLDRPQRVLLALHDVEGYSLAELVEMTGVKEGTLKSRLHRARVRLGRLLQRDEKIARPSFGERGRQ